MHSNKVRSGPHRTSDLFDTYARPELNIIWGIYVGEGCVAGYDPLSWREIEAHAHSLVDDEWYGWICVANPRAVVTPKGKPTHTVLHELAHLILKNRSHNKKWADTVIQLGARAEANKYYKKKPHKEFSSVKDERPHDGQA